MGTMAKSVGECVGCDLNGRQFRQETHAVIRYLERQLRGVFLGQPLAETESREEPMATSAWKIERLLWMRAGLRIATVFELLE